MMAQYPQLHRSQMRRRLMSNHEFCDEQQAIMASPERRVDGFNADHIAGRVTLRSGVRLQRKTRHLNQQLPSTYDYQRAGSPPLTSWYLTVSAVAHTAEGPPEQRLRPMMPPADGHRYGRGRNDHNSDAAKSAPAMANLVLDVAWQVSS
jgi:hypothetical protein